ncbi:hypothetical protein HYQ46_010268 [Verticillium longisporum]|nr:hypothetical protein HYQ46_010268 [Verticillium longisporum]
MSSSGNNRGRGVTMYLESRRRDGKTGGQNERRRDGVEHLRSEARRRRQGAGEARLLAALARPPVEQAW